MSIAVIQSGGKQYKVTEGQIVSVEKITGLETGKEVVFKEVLLAVDGDKVSIGKPTLPGAEVSGEVIDPVLKAPKVIAYKFRRREGYHRTVGHRQRLTKVKIKSIKF